MIRPALKSDDSAIAVLHRNTLTNSFLAKLGPRFLKSLYAFLIQKENVIIHAEENTITGFVSFSYNSAGMMKRFLFSCPVCIFILMRILLTSPAFLKQVIETFTAPFKSKISNSSSDIIILPRAELLSISVHPDYQKSGIGSQLIARMEKRLLGNGILKYKVIAGASLEGANKLYLKNGFVLVSPIMIHGNELSNIYVKHL